jgi:hypothetical protein
MPRRLRLLKNFSVRLAEKLITAQVRSVADIEQAITLLGREQGGLVAPPPVFMNVHRGTVSAFSIRNNVPVIFDGVGFAKDGGRSNTGQTGRTYIAARLPASMKDSAL